MATNLLGALAHLAALTLQPTLALLLPLIAHAVGSNRSSSNNVSGSRQKYGATTPKASAPAQLGGAQGKAHMYTLAITRRTHWHHQNNHGGRT